MLLHIFLFLLEDITTNKADVQGTEGTIVSKPPVPQKDVVELSTRTNDSNNQETPLTQPVIASTTTTESKGFSSNISISVPLLNQALPLPPDMNGSAQEQPGIIISRSFETRDPVKPVLGRDDIFQSRPTGFPSGLSSGFELPTERDPPEYENRNLLSESFTFQTEKRHQPPGFDDNDQHGFSLQPAIGAFQPGGLEQASTEDIFSRNVGESNPKTGGIPAGNISLGEVSSDEDTPPPESLRNIKSIVKKRREAQNNTKPPTGRQREAKKGSPKVVRRGATPGGRGNKLEDKAGKIGKVGRKQGVAGDGKNIVVDDRFGWKDRTGISSSRESKGKRVLKSQRDKVRKIRAIVKVILTIKHIMYGSCVFLNRQPT